MEGEGAQAAGKRGETNEADCGGLESHVTCRATFEAEELAAKYPPQFSSPNKKLVYDLACPSGAESHASARGQPVKYARYTSLPLPQTYRGSGRTLLEMREDAFTYDVTPRWHEAEGDVGRLVVSWHKNFAHSRLFVAYSGGLFAQDEMQVAEHPILMSLVEALQSRARTDKRYRALTREGNDPTPILIRGVERRVWVKTDRNPSAGRPMGLYGNAFSSASALAIRNATMIIDPPTISNIFALEAPPGGHGTYRYDEILFILRTAYSGYRAAVAESFHEARERGESAAPFVIIHTGNWGTGAYGGNKVLMAILQVVAARLADVDKLVYHTFEKQYSDAFKQGMALLDELVPNGEQMNVDELVGQLTGKNFKWGFSDGN